MILFSGRAEVIWSVGGAPVGAKRRPHNVILSLPKDL